MPTSTFLDNLQTQHRSENVSGTIPNKQVDLTTNCFASSENLQQKYQLFCVVGMILDMSYLTF